MRENFKNLLLVGTGIGMFILSTFGANKIHKGITAQNEDDSSTSHFVAGGIMLGTGLLGLALVLASRRCQSLSRPDEEGDDMERQQQPNP